MDGRDAAESSLRQVDDCSSLLYVDVDGPIDVAFDSARDASGGANMGLHRTCQREGSGVQVIVQLSRRYELGQWIVAGSSLLGPSPLLVVAMQKGHSSVTWSWQQPHPEEVGLRACDLM